MTFSKSFLEQAALVVAHPDDEALWFSSIIRDVDRIIICILGNERHPERAAARRRVLEKFPIENIECLGLSAPLAFNQADWPRPKETEFGLQVAKNSAEYERCHQTITQLLEKRLVGYEHVFTHNPWGEYGHEMHVQVSRIVHQLSTILDFQVWFSNYASSRSSALASSYIFGKYEPWVSKKTDIPLAHQIRDLYIEEKCWTAPGDFKWFPEECFASLSPKTKPKESSNLFPLNFLSWPQSHSLRERTEKRTSGPPTSLPNPQKWVFIVGCYNSGTTLLETLVRQHDQIGFLPAEGQVCTDQFVIPAKVGLPRLWALKPELFTMTEETVSAADPQIIKRQWGERFSDKNLPILLEKSCPNAGRTRWLQKHFRNSHFIGIVRNGYAVAEGISRKSKHSVENSAKQWALSNEIMLEDFKHLENAILITYEELAEATENTMRRIWNFLGVKEVPFEAGAVYTIQGVTSKIENMNSKSLASLDESSKEKIKSIAGSMLSRLSYEGRSR